MDDWARAEISRMTLRRLNADPAFRAKNATPEIRARKSERMRLLNADPTFAAQNAERMRAMVAKQTSQRAAYYATFGDWTFQSDGE